METTDPPGDRELYPESPRFDAFTGDRWVVREIKNTQHVIFEFDGAVSPLLHVEGDGVEPRASVFPTGIEDMSALLFSRDAESFQDALEMAEDLMRLFETGYEMGHEVGHDNAPQ